MINVKRYNDEKKDEWNQFCKESKNPLFMFNRDYMEYHQDRFFDHSLMFYDGNKLIALLPLSEKLEILVSHGGLTYGGFITSNKMKQSIMNECFSEFISYAKEKKFKTIIYKTVPHIYHLQPAEEDRYSLYINNAELLKIEPTTVINLKEPLKMANLRKRQISKAKREKIIVEELKSKEYYDSFIALLNSVLLSRHNTHAVHSSEELFLLHNRFPNNIRLYGTLLEKELIAGTVIFEYDKIVHTQYLAANDIARKIGALDLIIENLITKYQETKLWFDFGISTEENGHILNEGLISQKEGFGGRTNIYETFKISL